MGGGGGVVGSEMWAVDLCVCVGGGGVVGSEGWAGVQSRGGLKM